MRQIEAGGYKSTTAPAAFRALSIASNLKKLHISHYDFCSKRVNFDLAKRTSIAGLVGHCEALLKALESSYLTQNKAFDMSQIIAIKLDPCTGCKYGFLVHRWLSENYDRCGCNCGDAESTNQELSATVSSEIREMLRKDEEGVYLNSKAKRRSDRNRNK